MFTTVSPITWPGERVTDLYGLEYSPESIALVALLHDVCKIGCYKPSTRNVKGEDGKWTQVPTFTYEDPLPLRPRGRNRSM